MICPRRIPRDGSSGARQKWLPPFGVGLSASTTRAAAIRFPSRNSCPGRKRLTNMAFRAFGRPAFKNTARANNLTRNDALGHLFIHFYSPGARPCAGLFICAAVLVHTPLMPARQIFPSARQILPPVNELFISSPYFP